MKIDEKTLKEVCKVGQGEACCRYILLDGKGFKCAKFTKLHNFIDMKVAKGLIKARGNNCPGLLRMN